MNSSVPVALFTYARPDLLRRVLEALRANEIPRLYAFSDAPRTARVAEDVTAVRQILREINWCEFTLVERNENFGLGRNVLDGVSQVLRAHPSVIVFEDDLVCVRGFYKYVAAALHHYADATDVMSITGWTHPRITPADVAASPYFDGKAACWTWATWARAWAGMDRTAMALMQECTDNGIDAQRYGSDMPKLAAEEPVKNLWATRWMYLHMLRGALCLRPPHSLVEHIGFDERATTSAHAVAWTNPPLRACPEIPAQWPAPRENAACRKLWRASIGE